MKRFFVLLLGLAAGLSAGFFGGEYIDSFLRKAPGYVSEKATYYYEKLQEKYQEYKASKSNNEAEVLDIESDEVLGLPESKEGLPEEFMPKESAALPKPAQKVAPATVQDVAPAPAPAEKVVEPEPEKEPEMVDTTHGNKGIAATINGRKITVDEIRYTYDVNPQIKDKVNFPEFYDKAVEVYVEGKLLYDKAVKNHVLETEEYKKQLELLKQDIARKVLVEKTVEASVTDAALKKFYEEYKKAFVPEKEIKAKHILVDDKGQAEEVIVKLGQGQDFVELAKKYSKEPADLGYFTKDMMIPEFGNAAFSMKVGEYSKLPVKSEYGYHVILVEDIRETKPATFEEAKPQMKQIMTNKVLESLYSDVKKNASVVMYNYNGQEVPFKGKTTGAAGK